MTNKEYYGFTEEVHELTKIYINNEIIINQSILVEEALKLDKPLCGICWDNIHQLYDKNGESQEVLEWWLITEWLANNLMDIGEPVLETDYGFYWGRTCSGQSIILDGTIQIIAKSKF